MCLIGRVAGAVVKQHASSHHPSHASSPLSRRGMEDPFLFQDDCLGVSNLSLVNETMLCFGYIRSSKMIRQTNQSSIPRLWAAQAAYHSLKPVINDRPPMKRRRQVRGRAQFDHHLQWSWNSHPEQLLLSCFFLSSPNIWCTRGPLIDFQSIGKDFWRCRSTSLRETIHPCVEGHISNLSMGSWKAALERDSVRGSFRFDFGRFSQTTF